MRILIVSNLCPPYSLGGYEIGCANMAAALHAAGHEIRLATSHSHLPGPPDPPYVDRCFGLQWFQAEPLPSDLIARYPLFHATISDYANTDRLLRLLDGFRPDIVYVWNLFGIGGLAMLDLLNIVGAPWVLHMMDDMLHHLLSGAPPHVRLLFGGTAGDIFSRGRVIAMSARLVTEIAETSGVTFDGGLDIIPGWVDLRLLPDPEPPRPTSPTRFVAASWIGAHKGVDLIVEAAAILAREGRKDFTVDIYGEGEVQHFAGMADRLGVAEMVHFLGLRSQAELIRSYADYHAFLFPTLEREPFGFAPIEAAACGCVPIMTRQCGAAERLVDVAHCLKIDRDVNELADAMRAMIDGTVDLPALGRRASAMVRADLSLDRALGGVVNILRDAARPWDRRRLADPRLPLLLHTKHHLAEAMTFGDR